jgi:hypothetical protein
VNVVAVAHQDYVLTDGSPTSWSHTFTNESCGQVLGATSPTPVVPGGQGGQVLGASTELANTGTNILATTLMALFVLATSLVTYFFVPKSTARQ